MALSGMSEHWGWREMRPSGVRSVRTKEVRQKPQDPAYVLGPSGCHVASDLEKNQCAYGGKVCTSVCFHFVIFESLSFEL